MLKPSDMGLTGIKTPISKHREKIEKKLETFIRAGGQKKHIGTVCMECMNSPSGAVVDIKNLRSSEINEIKNYFAECAGPIWSQERGLIPGLRRNDNTYFSNSDTEGMYDFKVWRKTEEILVSNKQIKGGTNTLKPGDVVRLVGNSLDLSKKWKNSKHYKVFQILDNSNVISGPITAVWKHYYRLVDIPIPDYSKVVNQMTMNDVILEDVPKSFIRLIKSDPTARERFEETGQVSGSMINFLFEKVLVGESQRDAKYDELFKDVTKGNILFFKFDLSPRGVVSYMIADPANAKKRATLRSKQGVERRSSSGRLKLDKLGFQP